MDQLPLNKAHQLIRRAESLQKQYKFEECIEAYRNALLCLHEASSLSENGRSKESIEMQIDHYQKQIDALQVRKNQRQGFKRYQESVKNRTESFENVPSSSDFLYDEVLRNIVYHDSLVELWAKRKSDDDSIIKENQTLNILGTKRQVDDSTQLEEYRVLSGKLRELVEDLMIQLEGKTKEVVQLKEEISKLKSEQNKNPHRDGNSLQVTTDSCGGMSPYDFFPCTELSPEVESARDFSSLPPLELPNFDFATLLKNTSSLNLNNSN